MFTIEYVKKFTRDLTKKTGYDILKQKTKKVAVLYSNIGGIL
jgi:mRNA-degrading endonuclease YafQ of YafQ-DinJ toxin-antitoxin module